MDHDDLLNLSAVQVVEAFASFDPEHDQMIEQCANVDGQPQDGRSHLVLAALARSRALVAGFLQMVDSRNRFCAIPLVRMQLDSAMRLHACRLVGTEDFVLHLLQGCSPRKFKGLTKVDLFDAALHRSLANEYPFVSEVYEDCSGYVHLSDKHLFGIYDQDSLQQGILTPSGHLSIPTWSDIDVKGSSIQMIWVTDVMTKESKKLLNVPKTFIKTSSR